MEKVAVMIDGSFLLKVARGKTKSQPTPEQVYKFAMDCIEREREELFRIYYYDCAPYSAKATNPLSKNQIDFASTSIFEWQKGFQDKLSRMDHIAFRRGELSFDGWKIGKKALEGLIKNPRSVEGRDLVPDLKQKRVDIKIGLDIAWLSSKNIVDKIILIAGDADLIPAMKFARREGVQIVLIPLGNWIKQEMREHTDEFRNRNWPCA
jgi:uncharacterized LabA/DUF88 family protein